MSKKKVKKRTSKNQLRIGIRSETRMFEEASAALDRWNKGKPAESVNRLYFPDAGYMWKQLSPQRLALLQELTGHRRPVSIRKLAQEVKRDYRAVHRDVQMLLSLDLIEKEHSGLLFVPWDSIVIELANVNAGQQLRVA